MLQFKYRKLVLDDDEIEWYCGIKRVFLENSLYVRWCPSTTLTFLQSFLKLAFLYLSLYLQRTFTLSFLFFFKPTCFQVNIACHFSKKLSSIRKETVVLLGPKLSIFLFQTYLKILFRNLELFLWNSCSLISNI